MAVQSTSPTGSQQVFLFQPVTPHGTPEATPYVTDLALPNYEVQLIRWRIPCGPQGNLGFQLWYSGALVLPQNGLWIIADDEFDKMELDELPTAGDWQFYGYNTGDYDHVALLTFYTNPLSPASLTAAALTVKTVLG
jgi:hypothetical protein